MGGRSGRIGIDIPYDGQSQARDGNIGPARLLTDRIMDWNWESIGVWLYHISTSVQTDNN